jgi:hypothetical protein
MKPFHSLAIALLAVAFAATGSASELDITARFRPSAAEPNITQFVNTTPVSGYCEHHPSLCGPGDFSITFPLVVARTWTVPGPIESQNYQRVDGNWKNVTVHSTDSGQPFDVRFRLNLLSRSYALGQLEPGGTPGNIGYVSNLSGVSGASKGGCSGRIGAGNGTGYTFAWTVPDDFRVCSRDSRPDAVMGPYSGSIHTVSIGYEMVAPNPMQLPNGTYTGQITYSLGEGRQIDLGPGGYSDDIVNFNFTLTVEHQIRVEFPANSDRVLLEPDGGWLDWLNKGRRPARLYREQPFRLWGSAPMHMYLMCEHTLGNRCGIANDRTGEQVPVDIAVSLPDAFRYQGQMVQKLALPVGQPAALNFDAVRPLFSGRSQLHYSVAQEHMAGMLANAGTTYKGDVTIIFDADI